MSHTRATCADFIMQRTNIWFYILPDCDYLCINMLHRISVALGRLNYNLPTAEQLKHDITLQLGKYCMINAAKRVFVPSLLTFIKLTISLNPFLSVAALVFVNDQHFVWLLRGFGRKRWRTTALMSELFNSTPVHTTHTPGKGIFIGKIKPDELQHRLFKPICLCSCTHTSMFIFK